MITIKARNIASIRDKISELPRGARGAASEGAAKALLGSDRTGLRHYPPRRSHGAGNPYQWTTQKQRRAYFASNGFGGGIPSTRTNALSEGWRTEGEATALKIVNDVPYARYVQGYNIQPGHTKDGWRIFKEVIETNYKAMMVQVNKALREYLVSKGLK